MKGKEVFTLNTTTVDVASEECLINIYKYRTKMKHRDFYEDYTDIMDTYNAHNKELVRKINAAWRDVNKRWMFGYIVYAIVQRDYSECEEKLNIDDMGDFLASIIDDNDKGAIRDVLEQVCDDRDLETILSFIGHK